MSDPRDEVEQELREIEEDAAVMNWASDSHAAEIMKRLVRAVRAAQKCYRAFGLSGYDWENDHAILVALQGKDKEG